MVHRTGIVGSLPLCLLAIPFHLTLMGNSSCQPADPPPDQDGDGYTTEQGDCDDTNPNIYPSAPEVCNGLDDNCNGSIDEGLPATTWYPDQDRDGFGTPDGAVTACSPPSALYSNREGDCDDTNAQINPNFPEFCDGIDHNCDNHVAGENDPRYYYDGDQDGFGREDAVICAPYEGFLRVRGDCNDNDDTVHPGATDPASDGIDRDCGGTDGPEPHVGFTAESRASIQQALVDAAAGATVWVGPGTYFENDVTMLGKAVKLRSTHFAEATTIDASRAGGHVVVFNAQEQAGSVLDGFTVTGGSRSGVYVEQATPTISYCVLRKNLDPAFGGGLYALTAAPTVDHTVIEENDAQTAGGGVYLEGSSVSLSHCTIARNGHSGVRLHDAHVSLSDSTIADNTSQDSGGGLNVQDGSATILRSTFAGNQAAGYGGGLLILDSTATLENCIVAGNVPGVSGGGLYLDGSSVTITQTDIVANRGGTEGGGGIYVYGTQTTLTNDILAYNAAYNLIVDPAAPSGLLLRYSDLYAAYGPSHNLMGLDRSNLEVDPRFLTFTHDGDPTNDDLHLSPASPLVDAGDPTVLDPDGSIADMGAYGGPDADRFYLRDLDGDGLYDGWEDRHGLSLHADDSGIDPDADGLTNRGEQDFSVDPQDPDTDGDGATDGEEVAAGSDPRDFYAQPGLAGSAIARVPGDFASIQAAIDAVFGTGDIVLGAGTFTEQLFITGKQVTITGEHGSAETILNGNGGVPLTAQWATLELWGLTVTGSHDAGASLDHVDGAFVDLVVTGNLDSGMTLVDSAPSFTDCTFTLNSSPSNGGGIYLLRSNATFDGCSFTLNSASGGGGAMMAWDSSPVLSDCELFQNTAAYGGGLVSLAASIQTSPALTGCSITHNTADNFGGGLVLWYPSTPFLTDCDITDNSVGPELGMGGGISLRAGAAPTLRSCTIARNTTVNGGGIQLREGSSIDLSDTTFSENLASDDGGGIQAASGTRVTLDDCDFTRNQATSSGGGIELESATLEIEGSVFTGNVAVNQSGGGIYGLGSITKVYDTTFQANTARSAGGGAVFGDTDPVVTPAQTGIERCTFLSNSAGEGGGLVLGGEGTVLYSRFSGNSAVNGGGLLAIGEPIIADSTFDGNQAEIEGGGLVVRQGTMPLLDELVISNNSSGRLGGGLYIDGPSPEVTHCTFSSNHSDLGGGAQVHTGDAFFENCLFSGNTATTNGGGLYLFGSNGSIYNVRFANNLAANRGAGLFMDSSGPTLASTLFIGGNANQGGGIFVYNASPTIVFSVIANNRATLGGGLYQYVFASNVAQTRIQNSILAYNSNYNFYREAGATTIGYTDLFAPFYGPNANVTIDATDFTVEPGFLTYANGQPTDFHLAKSSPLVDAGSPGLTDADGSRADPGIYGGFRGGRWDLDDDGFPDWFWPGTLADAPGRFDPADYDANDLDPAVH